ncbi:MAG: LysM peptidoglycan-binding domain-containing protein [Anaerolineae bacterium]|nr:LysM peptidoglycan-binding domain-containing protein [Anaerolineae bacterium]
MVRLVRQLTVIAVVAVLAFGAAAQPVHAQNQVHVVGRGETLSSIAARYGTTVAAIVQANGLPNPNYIYAGQRLVIPGGSSSAASSGGSGRFHTVGRGDTLYGIAARYGTTVAAIMRANGLQSSIIYVGQRLAISGAAGSSGTTSGGAATGSQTYTVQRGDTLSAIAYRHSTTVAAIMRANGLQSSIIYVGQRLAIPGAAGSSGATGGGAATGSQAYTVQRGDTLSAIATRYGTTVAAIMQANGLHSSIIYVGQRLAIPGAAGSSSATSGAVGSGKRIVVDLSEQRMYVYHNGQLLWKWVVSTGRPGQETAVGHYKVLNKIPNAYAYTWSLQMPYWLGIYWAGSLQNGIHALPIQANGLRLWAGYLGQRVSFGCIILSTENAQTLYNWAEVGTPVDIVW